MSIEGIRFNIAPLLWNGFSITQCGRTICSPGHAVPQRLYGHYSLHFIMEGAGRYHVNGVTYRLHAGEGFLISPDLPCCYTADEEDPWNYMYVSFSGQELSGMLREVGLSSPVFSFFPDYRFQDLLNAILFSAADPDCRGLEVNGLFFQLLDSLSLCTAGQFPGREDERYVAQAVAYIEDNYAEKITVQEVADRIGINRSYLHKLFTRAKGLSPSRYLLNYRLDRARDMMMHREFSLTEIAVAVGFCDAAHFSKSFTARFDTSPRTFREEILGKDA